MLRQASVGFALWHLLFAFAWGVGLIGLGASHPRTGVCIWSVSSIDKEKVHAPRIDTAMFWALPALT